LFAEESNIIESGVEGILLSGQALLYQSLSKWMSIVVPVVSRGAIGSCYRPSTS